MLNYAFLEQQPWYHQSNTSVMVAYHLLQSWLPCPLQGAGTIVWELEIEVSTTTAPSSSALYAH
jgi:hypothetical protein